MTTSSTSSPELNARQQRIVDALRPFFGAEADALYEANGRSLQKLAYSARQSALPSFHRLATGLTLVQELLCEELTARSVFETGVAGEALPQVAVPREALERGMPAFELFARAGLAASNSEARRLIKGGGARVNDSVVAGETQPLSLADLDAQGQMKLSAGRKRHALVRPE